MCRKKYYDLNKARLFGISCEARMAKTKAEISEASRVRYRENKPEILQRQKAYLEENRELVAMQQKAYRERNRIKINKYQRIRRRQNHSVRLANNVRKRVWKALKGHADLSVRTEELIGCKFHELKEWLENQFVGEMTWDNYGEWHVDHIRPVSSFDLSDSEQRKECFHFSNLQPLWALDNLKKKDKWDGVVQDASSIKG